MTSLHCTCNKQLRAFAKRHNLVGLTEEELMEIRQAKNEIEVPDNDIVLEMLKKLKVGNLKQKDLDTAKLKNIPL